MVLPEMGHDSKLYLCLKTFKNNIDQCKTMNYYHRKKENAMMITKKRSCNLILTDNCDYVKFYKPYINRCKTMNYYYMLTNVKVLVYKHVNMWLRLSMTEYLI